MVVSDAGEVIENVAGGDFFTHPGGDNQEGWFWQFEPFSKLKNNILWILNIN